MIASLMEIDEPQPEETGADSPPARPWFGRRKQIASREITPTTSDVEAEMRAAARGSLKPADVIDIPSLRNSPPPELILDPTLFSVRLRRPGQNFAYRLTQFLTALVFIGASAAIANSFVGHRLRAIISAALACIVCAVAVKVVRKSRLAYRLRGYVAASGIFAVLALAMSLMPTLFHVESTAPLPEKKTAVTNPS